MVSAFSEDESLIICFTVSKLTDTPITKEEITIIIKSAIVFVFIFKIHLNLFMLISSTVCLNNLNRK